MHNVIVVLGIQLVPLLIQFKNFRDKFIGKAQSIRPPCAHYSRESGQDNDSKYEVDLTTLFHREKSRYARDNKENFFGGTESNAL